MMSVFKIFLANGSFLLVAMSFVVLVLIAEYLHILYGLYSDYKEYKKLLGTRKFW
jgi:hypothetical protein